MARTRLSEPAFFLETLCPTPSELWRFVDAACGFAETVDEFDNALAGQPVTEILESADQRRCLRNLVRYATDMQESIFRDYCPEIDVKGWPQPGYVVQVMEQLARKVNSVFRALCVKWHGEWLRCDSETWPQVVAWSRRSRGDRQILAFWYRADEAELLADSLDKNAIAENLLDPRLARRLACTSADAGDLLALVQNISRRDGPKSPELVFRQVPWHIRSVLLQRVCQRRALAEAGWFPGDLTYEITETCDDFPLQEFVASCYVNVILPKNFVWPSLNDLSDRGLASSIVACADWLKNCFDRVLIFIDDDDSYDASRNNAANGAANGSVSREAVANRKTTSPRETSGLKTSDKDGDDRPEANGENDPPPPRTNGSEGNEEAGGTRAGNGSGRGRSPTDLSGDFRIVQAWSTGRHGSKKDLADSLGKTLKEVERAIDRDRKRRRKT